MFSVIIPVHNVEPYIDKCIASILNQGDYDFEILLVENCSTDNSLEKCRAYSEKDAHVKLIVADKPGVSNARNLAIKQAAGDWLVFVDADDYLLDGAFANLKSVIDTCACDMVAANYTQSDSPEALTGARGVVSAVDYANAMLDTPRYFAKMNSGLTWNPGLLGVNWAKAFKRSIIADNGVLFDEHITIFEDLLFNLTFLKYAKTIGCLDKPVYYYRVAPGSLSRTKSDKRVSQRIDYLNSLLSISVDDELIEAKNFHIGQNVLRTYVVASRVYLKNKTLRSEIRSFAEKPEIQSLLHNMRGDNLSNGRVQKQFFVLLLSLLRKKQYHLASLICWIYAKFKKKT